jgi:NUMOD1 domain
VIRIRDYYVYGWFNINTGEVFYIGKGTKTRYRTKKGRNSYFTHYLNKHKCSSRILYNKLTEDEAYTKEVETIAYYKNIGQAKCNLTDGGENPPTNYGLDNPLSRQVIQLTLEGNFVNEWNCIIDAAKHINVSESSISSCCKHKYGHKSHGGYLWVYKEEYDPNKTYTYNPDNNARPIIQFDVNGDFIKEWPSAIEINKTLGIRRSGICSCCNGTYHSCNGYIWRYKDEVKNTKHIKVEKRKIPVPVVQLDLNGNYINRFNNCTKAASSIGIKSNSHIVKCCNNKEKTAYGFKWMFEHEYVKQIRDCNNPFFVKEVV